MKIRSRTVFCALTLMLFLSAAPVGRAWSAVFDDVCEAFLTNGLKRAGRNADEIASITRKGAGSFSQIVARDGDYLRRVTKLLDDDTLGLGKKLSKIDDVADAVKGGRHTGNAADAIKRGRRAGSAVDAIKSGGRHADDISDAARRSGRAVEALDEFAGISRKHVDDFLTLKRGERALVLSMQSMAQRIAKLPDGADILMVTGKKGALLAATYGDEAVVAAYKMNKGGVLSFVGETRRVGDADLFKFIKQGQLDDLLDARALKRIGNLDEIDAIKNVTKRYGPKGARNISQFCVDVVKRSAGYAMDNPGKVLTAAIVVTVLTKPEVLVDAAGNVMQKTVDVFGEGLARVAGEAAGSVMKMPSTAGDALIERWIGDAPDAIKGAFRPIASFLILMGVLWFFNSTRFIPRFIFRKIGASLSWLFSAVRRCFGVKNGV